MNIRYKIYRSLLNLVWCSFLIGPSVTHGQCVFNGINGIAVPILDNMSFDIKIEVEDANHSDLSSVQGICGVRLNFSHLNVSDLHIELIAPNDTTVTLIGPALINGTTASLFIPINHEILFVPDSSMAMPDPSTPARWTNLNPNWANRANYRGTYYPFFGDLESAFNNGPVDGVWTIRVTDAFLNQEGLLNSVELIFCDPSGITCNICQADGGSYGEGVELCEGDMLLPEEWESSSSSVQTEYALVYVLDDGTNQQMISEQFAFEGLSAGLYSIFAISVRTDDSTSLISDLQNGIILDSLSDEYCFSVSNPPLDLMVIPTDTSELTLPFCSGQPTIFNGVEVTNPDTIIYRMGAGCATVERISYIPSIVNAFIPMDTILLGCNNFTVNIDGSASNLGVEGNIIWIRNDFLVPNENSSSLEVDRSGLYTMQINDNGCVSRDTTRVVFEILVKTYDFTFDKAITCDDSVANIAFSDLGITNSTTWRGPSIIGNGTNVEMITVDLPGIYTVTGMDTAGCAYNESISIGLENEVASFDITADTFSCDNPRVTVIINTPDDNMLVTWNQSGAIVSDAFEFETSSPDTIFINLLGENGCSSDTFYLPSSDMEFVSIIGRNDTINCNQPSVSIGETAQPNVSYQWSFNNVDISSMPSINVLESGVYMLVAAAGNACVDTAFYNITVDTLSPLLSIFSDGDISCIKDSTELGIVVADGALVEWKFPDVENPSDLTQVVYSDGNYAVEVINPINGCMDQNVFTVLSTMEDPMFTIEKEDVTCTNPMGLFRITSQELITVTLSINGAATIEVSEFEISDSASIFYTVTGESGCTIEGFEMIDNNIDFPTLNIPNDLSLDCADNTVHLSPFIDTTVADDFYFVLANGDTIRSDSLFIDSATTVEVVVVGINACITSKQVNINESIFNNGFDFGIVEGLYCDRSQLDVDLSIIADDPQLDYNWILEGASPSVFEVGNITSLSGEGTFILELTDVVNNCAIADTFSISFTDSPLGSIVFSTEDESCPGEADGVLNLDPLMGGQGMLTVLLDGVNIDMSLLDSFQAGMYTIEVIDEIGCMIDTVFNINVGGGIAFELGEDLVVIPREEVNINPIINSVSEVISTTWIFNGDTISTGGSVTFIPREEGVLILTATNVDGCEYSDSLRISRALALEDLVMIPNALAPFSATNDALRGIFSDRIINVSSFSIFDRWGNKIHHLQNLLPDESTLLWNGRVGGKLVASGVYVYYIEVELDQGSTEMTAGDITVMY